MFYKLNPNVLRQNGAIFNGFTDGNGRRVPSLYASELNALCSALGMQYQSYYVLAHGAINDEGGLLPTKEAELRAVIEIASIASPRTVDDAVQFAQKLSSGTTRVLILPAADLEVIKRRREWWFLLEYIGMSQISLDVWATAIDDSFDYHLSRLVAEARVAAQTSGRTTLEELKQILRETLEDAGIEVGPVTPEAPENSGLLFNLVCYSLLAKRWGSVEVFLSAIPMLIKQAPLDYFSSHSLSAWKKGGVGFSQLLYESLAVPSAVGWDESRKNAQSFEEAQAMMRLRRFTEDLSAFIPKVNAWVNMLP